MVVQQLRAINTHADKEVVFLQELGPILIDEGAVGLKRVSYTLTGLGELGLVIHGLLEEIQTHEGRLAALPGDAGIAPSHFQVLAGEGSQHPL